MGAWPADASPAFKPSQAFPQPKPLAYEAVSHPSKDMCRKTDIKMYLCVCVHMFYMCMYIYIYIYICTYLYIDIYTYLDNATEAFPTPISSLLASQQTLEKTQLSYDTLVKHGRRILVLFDS